MQCQITKYAKLKKKYIFSTDIKCQTQQKISKRKFKKIIEFELLENKISKINKIKIEKTREIIRKRLKELEIKRTNKTKEQEEIETKIIIERMKEESEGF